MSAPIPTTAKPQGLLHELQTLRNEWWWLLILGAVMVVGGVVSISYPFMSSVGVAIVIGTVLLVSGLATIVSAFWTGQWSGFLLQLLTGILYVVIGLAITDAPVVSMMALTLVVATFAVVSGVFRVAAALALRFPQWGWSLLNGVVTAIFGMVIFRHFPEASLWVIGTLIGVELLFNGTTWIMLSLQIRALPELAETDSTKEPQPEA